MYTERLSESLEVVDWITPVVGNDEEINDVNGIDMSQGRRAIFIVEVGVTDATVSAQVFEAVPEVGVQAMAGKLIEFTALDDDTLGVIEVAAEEMSAGYTHLLLGLTVGVGAVTGAYVSAVGLLSVLRDHPAAETADVQYVA